MHQVNNTNVPNYISSMFIKIIKSITILQGSMFALPHSRGSSHGSVRILRYPYTDLRHHQAMPEQYEMWHELEKEAGTQLTHKISMLRVTPTKNEVYRLTFSLIRQSQLACLELSEAQVKEKYPFLDITGRAAFLQEECLTIDAHKAVQCLQSQFVKNGGVIRDNEKVLKIEPGPVVTVHTNKGGCYRAKGIILAPGTWASGLLKSLGLNLPIKAWRVNVCYFKEKVPESHRKIPCVMYHTDEGFEKVLIVFPSREYPGLVKINYHLRWDEVDPECRDLEASKTQLDIEEIKMFVKERMPALELEPVLVEPCLYTCMPEEDLLVDTHPLYKNIAIACAMSGKGFKMAPLIGKVLGEMALGKPPSFDTSLLSFKRFLSTTSRPKL
ncbi:peroxisomal sarcosine oxidase-like isoform X2 [Acanthaster planci]|uniref:Peroxisomal sarcosine oxidase-like isoform X2 n=1 Tax=Acanthaster planci TaxID=133434 RepID=A0A8B7YL82_ACAPL|nr:peroxisomal sarcosine oxidase-like isoform X2 [Acanthaster planci]